MEAVAPAVATSAEPRWRVTIGAAAAWTVPFLLVLYLALSNGGYGIVERSEVGIALWWLILVGALVGAFGVPRENRLLPVAFALLLAFTGWTALALSWTGSDERTMIELARVATFLAAFTLASTAQAAGRWRAVLGGTTAAVGLIVVLAVLSRMHPDLFPEQTAGEAFPNFPDLEARLAYPLNYSSGLAALSAMAVPLLLRAASEARSIGIQSLAGGLIPIAGLAIWLTGSSLAIPLLIVAIVSYLLLAPDRLPKILTLVFASAGTVILVAGTEARSALDLGLTTPAAYEQGDELFLIALLVVVAVATLQTGLSLAVRHGNRPRILLISRRQATIAAGTALAVGLVGFALSPGPGALNDGWDAFRGATLVEADDTSRASQILDVSSSGRYQFWASAADAFDTAPFQGIGPGTFEFWWAENGTRSFFIRDAHSLFAETLAELGLPGLALIGGFILLVLLGGATRAMRAGSDRRGAIAAATAAACVFGVATGLDWMWELGALGLSFAVLAGIALGADGNGVSPRPALPLNLFTRAAVGGLAVAGFLVIAITLGGAVSVERSQAAAREGELAWALAAAEDATALQPYAAAPQLQRALLLEEQGRYAEALVPALEATRNEPENWRNWLVLSRIEAEAGNAGAAVGAYREARRLNPRSALFAP